MNNKNGLDKEEMRENVLVNMRELYQSYKAVIEADKELFRLWELAFKYVSESADDESITIEQLVSIVEEAVSLTIKIERKQQEA